MWQSITDVTHSLTAGKMTGMETSCFNSGPENPDLTGKFCVSLLNLLENGLQEYEVFCENVSSRFTNK